MTDIVERLRIAAKEPCDGCCYGETMELAADEIERLRAQLSWIDSDPEQMAQAKIVRLRAALQKIIEANSASGHLEVPQTKIARAALKDRRIASGNVSYQEGDLSTK